MQNECAGLYIHIPFCRKKCLYCDFFSIEDTGLEERYIGALLREMELRREKGLTLDTLYLGGGTPSVLSVKNISKIIDKSFQEFNFRKDTEITIEVNPGTIKKETFDHYRRAGINRINIGVQSFNDRNLTFLGRIHTSSDAKKNIQHARNAGFENIGIDLIFGLPEQNETSWKKDLYTGISFQPEHFSCYMLTYEKGTPLTEQLESKEFIRLPDENVGHLFEKTIDHLAEAGYAHYEVSNYARGKSQRDTFTYRSRHNGKYWQHTPYIGLGPSAHSFSQMKRSWNFRNVHDYLSSIEKRVLPVEDSEVLSKEQHMIEMIYLGLRTTEGIRTNVFAETFDMDFDAIFHDVVTQNEKDGYLRHEAGRCYLTRKGLLLLDTIASLFIEKI